MESSQPLRGLGFGDATLVALVPGPAGSTHRVKDAAEILSQRLEYLDRLCRKAFRVSSIGAHSRRAGRNALRMS